MQNTILIHAPGRRQGRGALVLAYTALFALLMGIWAAIFALNGQSFIQYGDTLKQHYPFLVYYGRWLRQAARCVLTGAAVPTWDFSIGYGADIITTLSYYGLGDPLDLLAAFVPGRWTEQLLEGLIVLRLYLAGLAFMAFSRRHGNSRFGTLLGALAYVFSAWPIQAGLIEPVFLVPMYCFPLMLLGADDLFEGRSPVLYIAAIALTALSNFLFFYMAAVLLVLYAIAVYSKRYGAKNLRTLPPLLAKFIGFALVGIAISAVTLLPTAQELFGSARFGLTRETAPYPFYRFFELLANMTTGMGYDAYSTYAGVTSAAFLGVLVLFAKPRQNTVLKCAWLGLLALLLVLVGHAFRLLRWEQFIRIYERPPRGQMLRGMAGGYALNFVLPFHLGDAFRAVYTGRRMKSGIGFALATVIMDRFLDVWFVAFGFIAFRLLGLGGAPVDGAARYYLVFSLLLVLGLVLVVALRDFLKKICLAFCGLFNDTLKLDGMMFFWSLINTFKDLGRVKIGRLVVNTLLMWAAYLGSYTALAAALTVAGEPMQLVDVFGLLFGRNAADFAALLPGGALGTAAPAARWLLLAWFVLPLLAMWAATLLPEGVRGAMNQATQAAPAGESYLNLLPQADEHDRAVFLSRYFGLENKDYVKRFLQMNRGITILEDYSAGSNATTMLCMDTQSTFYRKYAFGKDGAKLAEQLDWLCAQQDRLPLCDILRSEEADGCCWYDMVYNPQAVGMFRYLHSNPVEKSRAILRAVLATLEDKLYKPTAVPADAEKIEKYIETKVDGNLKKLHEDRMLRELMSYDTLRINGVEYKNLPALDWMFDHDRLRNLFAKDPVGTIHGDLTIENIICRTDNDSWYLIDPNTGNLHESPFLDYGKLLQSLHGSYEFMMKTPRVAVQDNRIDFQLTRSAAYDALLAAVMEDLSARYPREQVESILMHEVIHWLRLMPYKLNKDRKRAAMFYAGLVMVANDVADFSEHKKETLC